MTTGRVDLIASMGLGRTELDSEQNYSGFKAEDNHGIQMLEKRLNG